jgi:hypothetical protein
MGRRRSVDERHATLNEAERQITECIDGDDIRITRIGPVSGGWDDAITLACGETSGSIMLLLGKLPGDISKQMKTMLPALRKREARRLAEVAAEDSTLIWLYK